MTVALAFAFRSPQAQFVAVVADSRLSLASGRAPIECFPKALELGPESVLLVAGDSVLPAIIGAELARPALREIRINRAKLGHRASVLEDWRQALDGQALVLHELKPPNVAIVVAGFLADGSPCLVRSEWKGFDVTMTLSRPLADHGLVVSGIGSVSAVGLCVRALQIAKPRHVTEALASVVSVIRRMIETERNEGIGGGILVGYAFGGAGWRWPLLKIDENHFYRGIRADPKFGAHEHMSLDYDSSLLLKADEAELGPYVTTFPSPIVTSSAGPGRTTTYSAEWPDDWVPNDVECEILDRPPPDILPDSLSAVTAAATPRTPLP